MVGKKCQCPRLSPSTHEKQRVSGSRVSICVCTLIPHSKLTFAPNIDKHRCLAADSQVRILAYFVSFITPV